MLSLLKPKLIIAAILASVLASVFLAHKVIVHKAVNKAIADTREQMAAEYTKRLLEASERAREREQAMVGSADKIRKDKDAQIASLNTRLGTALSSLSERPQRADSASKDTPASCSCSGATGASLSREDSEFLVREAARADKLRSALDQCYRQYDAVRQSLSK